MSTEEYFGKMDKSTKDFHDWLKSRIEEYDKKDTPVDPLLLTMLRGAILDIGYVLNDSSTRSKILLDTITSIKQRLSQLEQIGQDVKELQKGQKEFQEMKGNMDKQVKERVEQIKKEQEDINKRLPE